MKHLILVVIASTLLAFQSFAQDGSATLRKGLEISEEANPPIMPQVENKDIKRKRNYPMQPPTIPHKIDNYQVDLRSNKCMSCHSRNQSEDSQAPMVSVTHYMDRDGNFLASISPRRYFCSQCHVPQLETKPLVENTFKDVNDLIKQSPQGH